MVYYSLSLIDSKTTGTVSGAQGAVSGNVQPEGAQEMEVSETQRVADSLAAMHEKGLAATR